MEDVKKTIEVDETMYETEEVAGFGSKLKSGIKKNGKKILVGAGVVAGSIVVGYVLGSKAIFSSDVVEDVVDEIIDETVK